MRSINPHFYKTKLWKQVRLSYALSKHCICERCGKPIYMSGINDYLPKDKRIKGIVHHKIHLEENNYTNDEIAYDDNNLELLCFNCHQLEHFSTECTRDGYKFDENGNLIGSK